MELTLRQMAALLGAEIKGKPDAKTARRKVEICIDSRAMKSGKVFWALRGERFDGHEFVEQGFQQGGDAAVVNKEWSDQNGKPARVYVPVGDTQEALTALARSYAERFRIPKIAVTGSNGKTTTKDMIAAVLRRSGKVLATEGNFNNHVGLPLTLFGLRTAHRYAVLEMGMSNPGEIRALSETAKPALAVVTNIGLAHLEGMGSREAIREEKLSIIAGFPGGRGTLFLNVDDPMLCDFRAPAKVRVVTYGVVWARLFERQRRAVMASRLMVIEGEVQRSKEGVVHLMATTVTDRTHELQRLSQEHDANVPIPHNDEFARPVYPRHGHPRDVRILPKSRDFH